MAGHVYAVEPIEPIRETSGAERVVADVHAIGASVVDAERVRDSVPLWFHTFALAPGVYTPGIARDHGYRLAVLGADRFAGRSVLDVGAFDGFYSFLAEVRGARRVVAVDNEQYVDWVRARFGVRVQGGGGFRAVAGLVGSRVEYRRMDALDVRELGERFEVFLCSLVRPDVGHITQVCVLPEYRSAGLGEAMLAASTRNLRGRGFHFISLTVTEANDRAIALYKRIGFESTRVFDAFVWEG